MDTMLRVQEIFTAESAETAEPFGVFRALGELGGDRLLAPDTTLPEIHRAHRDIVPIVIDSVIVVRGKHN